MGSEICVENGRDDARRPESKRAQLSSLGRPDLRAGLGPTCGWRPVEMNTSAGCLDVVIVLRILRYLCLDDVSGFIVAAFSFIAIIFRCKWQISLHIYKRGTIEI